MSLQFISFNCRSIRNKTQAVLSYLDENNIDLACFQETWLNEGDGSILVEIKEYNYNIINQPRRSKKGGGLILLYKPSILMSKIVLKCCNSFKTFEHLLGKIVVDRKSFTIVNLYRPPYSVAHKCTKKMFMLEFESFLGSLLDINKNILIFGDFNININDHEDLYTNQFEKLLEMFNLIQVVEKPTHIKGGLIDLVIITDNQACSKFLVENVTTLQSDHFPVKFELQLDAVMPNNATKKIIFKDMDRMDWDNFGKDLRCSSLNDASYFTTLSLDEVVLLYEMTLTQLYEKHCPTIIKRYRPNHSKSLWYNSKLQTLKQRKRRYERLYRKTPNPNTFNSLRGARNEYNKELKLARSTFYSKKIDECAGNPKQFHKILGKLTGYTKERSLPHCDNTNTLAEEFSTYFSEKVTKIRQSISSNVSTEQRRRFTTANSTFQCFEEIDLQELIKVASQMNSKTCDLDPVPTIVVKKYMTLLAPVILRIINLSITTCTFPSSLKHAIVTPVAKSSVKSKEDLSNYRPVSNLPYLSKIIEKIISDQLTMHVEGNNLYAKHQSAYRKNHSCETCIFPVVDHIQRCTQDNNYVLVISLDSSSAFDTVDHGLLLERLEHQRNITDQALQLIRSYLFERTYSIKVGKVMSKPTSTTYGVPQGSLLGPQFYNLYTSELEDVIVDCGVSVQMYADDILLYLSFDERNERNAELRVNACLDRVKSWMESSFLKLNMEKTVVKLFLPKRSSNTALDLSHILSYGNTTLKLSTSITFLGVKLSENQKLTTFITEKVRKCNFILRNIAHLSDCLPFRSKVTLVTNLILSSLDYSNSLLACATDKDIRPLKLILNRAVRFIFKIRWRDHITEYLYKLHFLPIKYRIKFKLSLMAFKIFNNMSPVYLCEEFRNFEPSTTISLRIGSGRDTYMFDESTSQNSIKNKLITEWNKLPYVLRTVESLTTFKSKLKTFYFRAAFADFI